METNVFKAICPLIHTKDSLGRRIWHLHSLWTVYIIFFGEHFLRRNGLMYLYLFNIHHYGLWMEDDPPWAWWIWTTRIEFSHLFLIFWIFPPTLFEFESEKIVGIAKSNSKGRRRYSILVILLQFLFLEDLYMWVNGLQRFEGINILSSKASFLEDLQMWVNNLQTSEGINILSSKASEISWYASMAMATSRNRSFFLFIY